MKQYMTTRKQYKDVKKFDHTQFDGFCRSIYECGYKDGSASVQGVDVEDVMEAVGGVKGVGPATLAKIKDAVIPLFRKEDQDG